MPLSSADVRGLDSFAEGVRIQIESPKGGIESVKISAHGRDIAIPESEFNKLKHVWYSDVSISHEGGYKALGGHTIYFILRFRGMFGGDPFEGAPMLEEKVTITVPENAPVTISRVRIKVSDRTIQSEQPVEGQPATKPAGEGPMEGHYPPPTAKDAPR